jgi:5-aminopentanamidase
MKIALASPPLPASIEDGLSWLEKLTKEAADAHADIICFPETFIPGYPLLPDYKPAQGTRASLQAALEDACKIAASHNIAIILPMDNYIDGQFYNLAYVIDNTGKILGYQSKNQLDPSEDAHWVAGKGRHLFEVAGVKFGIVICHEGFRYPELVRWAARQGASVVFHPHCAGSNVSGPQLTQWGQKENPYYEKAMMMRALENTIYFASTNYAFTYPESASAVVDPVGECVAHAAYGKTGILLADIDPAQATGLLANRFKPELLK